MPKKNRAFWTEKFERNIARDRVALTALRRRGFTVVVIWECETSAPARIARRLSKAAAIR